MFSFIGNGAKLGKKKRQSYESIRRFKPHVFQCVVSIIDNVIVTAIIIIIA